MSKQKQEAPTLMQVKITQGLAMVDPLTGVTYTSAPTRVEPSSWVSAHLALGHLVEA